MDYQEAWTLVDRREGGMVETLRELVRIDTSVPPGRNYERMVDYLEPRFRAAGLRTERVMIPWERIKEIRLPLEGPRVNLVATLESGLPPVTVYAHMDAVPVEEEWKTDPFKLTLEGGRIYGRGVSDMKGSIASLLGALDVAQELGLRPKYDLICVMCTDEEIGGCPGVCHLAELGRIRGHVLCMEGFQDPGMAFWLGSAGMIDAEITTRGVSCHSGMNFLGVNALEAMVPVLDELMKLKAKVERRESSIPAFRIPKRRSDWMTPMLNLDIIRAGTKSNIVPSTCVLTVNRRFIVEETMEEVMREITEAVERGKSRGNALRVDVEFGMAYPAARYNGKTEHVEKMKTAFKLVHGYKEEDFMFGGIGGSTDMAFVARVLETDDFVFSGLARPDSKVHGADENILLSDLKAHAKELLYYLYF